MAAPRVLIIACALGFVSSCGNRPYASKSVSFEDESWYQDSVISLNVTIEDTTVYYQFRYQIRHSNDYPYQNLYLFPTVQSEGMDPFNDTLNLPLAENNGKWLGKGIGSLKTVDTSYFLKKHSPFPRREKVLKDDWQWPKAAEDYWQWPKLENGKNGIRFFKFKKPGTYTFTIQHGMRNEPLIGISDFVFSIEDTLQ